MTVLSACGEAAIELNQSEPSTLVSSTDQFAKELLLQANRTAVAVAKAYDWQALLAVHMLTGDGTTTSFPLPDDYDRMTAGAEFLTSSFGERLLKARDTNQWLDFQVNNTVIGPPGRWIIVGGTIQILPALATGVTVKFYYIKNTIVSDGKTAFTANADTFMLPERLLPLGIVWRWRAQKRYEYAEDMRNFEIALAEEVSRDKGSRVLTVGRQRMPVDAELAHPAIVV